MANIVKMGRRLFLLFACCFLLGAGSDPNFELLPEGAVYLVNSTDHKIKFVLETNLGATLQELPGGGSMVHYIPDFENNILVVKLSTGDKTVQYKLKSEGRYVFYWNVNESRFDVGTSK